MSHRARAVLRFIVVWIIDTLSVGLTALLFPGIALRSEAGTWPLLIAFAAAFLLGIVNLLIRPLLLLLALPFGFLALFVFSLFLNAVALMITSRLLPAFYVDGWVSAFLGSLIIAVIHTLLASIFSVEDDFFYQGVVERIARRQAFFEDDFETRGIVMLEIDGLSYPHIQKAIAEGWMPTLKKMLDEEGYVLTRVDCGLPSQTSACQAGILFGDNFDIPAFRWFEKEQNRLIVSGHDAPLINRRYARGHGLLRGGSSINNMLNGDARVSILTLADLRSGNEELERRRAQDMYLLLLNPYFLMRTLVLYIADVLVELAEGIWQQLRRQEPRLNRLEHFYPLIRAATTVLMREVSTYLAILDIVRGTPALYVTWPGYDEVAHHSGPWSKDAFRTLRQYDRVIARVREVIARRAPRPYELIILSDHGQSYGWTFKQRYGQSLKEFIEAHLPAGTSVAQTAGGDDGILSVAAMAAELDNIQRQGLGGRIGRRMVRRAHRAMQRGVDARTPALPTAPTKVIVCASGNLAQVYFDLHPRRLFLSELNAAYPGMVDALVQHEGIGVVVAYDDDGEPIAFGKHGARNLHTHHVIGQDPLRMYGDPDLRAEQLRRVADFPHNGDLTIISTVYPDGTVAAMEELIGNHGGLGGEQTDAFVFHPATFQIPATKNAVDLFHVLNARRGLPAQAARSVVEELGHREQKDPHGNSQRCRDAQARAAFPKKIRARDDADDDADLAQADDVTRRIAGLKRP